MLCPPSHRQSLPKIAKPGVRTSKLLCQSQVATPEETRSTVDEGGKHPMMAEAAECPRQQILRHCLRLQIIQRGQKVRMTRQNPQAVEQGPTERRFKDPVGMREPIRQPTPMRAIAAPCDRREREEQMKLLHQPDELSRGVAVGTSNRPPIQTMVTQMPPGLPRHRRHRARHGLYLQLVLMRTGMQELGCCPIMRPGLSPSLKPWLVRFRARLALACRPLWPPYSPTLCHWAYLRLVGAVTARTVAWVRRLLSSPFPAVAA